MKRSDWRIPGGILLIVGGILLLFQSFGMFRFLVGLLWSLLLGVAGVAFLITFLSNREQWWALIPGFALIGLAATALADQVIPMGDGGWGGALFLGALSVAFWLVYLTDHERWWAVIPGGVLMTIAAVAGLSSFSAGIESGGVLFLGLGLTFGTLAFVPTPQGQLRWALIPATVLSVMGLLLAFAPILRHLWPIVLILIGLYVILRAFGVLRRW
ncbi:MAG: hypothetical protein ISS56_01340 [Anaerolineae bacterium]|nr:hypothetical protein [Anaerolineae bacterium]